MLVRLESSDGNVFYKFLQTAIEKRKAINKLVIIFATPV